ncbi:MAG: hypothetical protein Q8Q69_04240, partial [Nitrosopumilaceae archaeon]|nr:hypothetical protein [Nitrosopumilaceae archaeon]
MQTEDYDPSEIIRNSDGTVLDNNEKTRWDLAGLLVKVGAQVMTMFDDDGISIRFLNKNYRTLETKPDNIISAEQVDNIFKSIGKPSGGTPIGSAINKIYDEFISQKLISGTLYKPILVVTYTDGVSSDSITNAVRKVREHTKKTLYGSKSVLFTFAQVGNDDQATSALESLDENPDSYEGAEDGAGDITDCTSSYKIEKAQYDKAQSKKHGNEMVPYTEIFHMMKGWLGPIMEKYDKADETNVPVNPKKSSIFGFN